jgi:hypothetical protein
MEQYFYPTRNLVLLRALAIEKKNENGMAVGIFYYSIDSGEVVRPDLHRMP